MKPGVFCVCMFWFGFFVLGFFSLIAGGFSNCKSFQMVRIKR